MSSFNSLDPVRFKTFLQLHSPFRELEEANREWVASQLTSVIFDTEQLLAGPDQGVPQGLFVLVHGAVRVIPHDAASQGQDEEETLASGACFPIGALSGRRAPSNAYVSTRETECLLLPLEKFHELLVRSAEFSRYCHGYLSSLVSQSRVQLQTYFSRQVSEQQSLSVELRHLIKRQPITLPPTASLRSVLELMGEKRIGSIIVADEAARPVGIFTQSDVLRRVVLGGAAMEGPIADVMTANPATLPETATAYDAMLAMAAKAIRHVVLVDAQSSIRGVISERDLFALQRVSVVHVRRSIEAAGNTSDLQRALADVRQCAFNMVAQGVASEQLTRFISTENDAVTERVLELNLARHDLSGIEWAWLAFGSEGREEQTLSTDQDNGIVFLADAEQRDSLRARLLAFAKDVNTDLDQCGFPLCQGNIMAGNPEWCLTLDEWQAKFSKWVQTPQPQALLNSTIFFDIRALYGRTELAAKMYAHLFALVRDNGIFQRMLAGNALSVSPPLAMIRDFVTESDENGKAFIDLKKSGARLFVDAARVMALRHAVPSASTVERLRRTARLAGGCGGSTEAIIDAFNFLQMLRLRHQYLEAGQGRPGDNRIFIGRLNPLERRILKESFRQAKDLQQGIKVTYQL
jgi:CBS domain-containing protein